MPKRKADGQTAVAKGGVITGAYLPLPPPHTTMAEALHQRGTPTPPIAALPLATKHYRMLPNTPRQWPRGTFGEATYILGDLGLSVARFVSWLISGIARLLFVLVRSIALGFGWILSKLSKDRMKKGLAEGLGWVLLVALLATTFPLWNNARAWAASLLPTQHTTHTHQAVPYLPPASACTLPRASCAPPSNFLDGQPSISAATILAVLQSYHSPAATADFAAQLYDLGIKYGVNPAYALGFFAEESQCGTTGIAVNNLSLGNIRYNLSSSPVTYTDNLDFRHYTTWRDGAEDWYWVIRTYYLSQGLRNIYDVTPVYAPSSDNNNPKNYADTVYQLVQSWGA